MRNNHDFSLLVRVICYNIYIINKETAMLNSQPKAPKVGRLKDGAVYVHSIFSTIQGEGPYAGAPATFIRLAGCNLDCPWCDTIYTGGSVSIMTPEEIIAQLDHNPLVVITGGEPFRQHFGDLVTLLHTHHFKIQIETNGTLFQPDFPYHLATLVCSPKLKKIEKQLAPYIRYYKYVAQWNSISVEDGLPIEVLGNKVRGVVARPPIPSIVARIYLQPMDSQDEAENKANLDAVIKSCKTFGHTLCLQIHKIIGVE